MYTYTYTYMYKYMYTNTYTYMYMYTYTYMYMYATGPSSDPLVYEIACFVEAKRLVGAIDFVRQN